jgi:hypothetical protein
MSKAAKVANVPGTDPTLPLVPITLDGKKYHLVYSFAALALAQKNLREQGVIVNLLHCLDLSNMDAERVVPLLYAAMITDTPKITVEAVIKLVTIRNLGAIFEGIANAYSASLADPDPADPIEPQAE